MTNRRLMRGNEAIAEATVRAGCRFVAGYPLTPATEILEYLSWRLPEVGGECVQAESEVAAINMVYGACATGSRAMTPTSGLGLSLMQECLSQMCAIEFPGVVVNMSRMGPGLGSLPPTQADYMLATRGAGHGDSRMIVLAPATVQEAADHMPLAFELAERYRNPVLVLGDAALAQVMEPVQFPELCELPMRPDWAVPGHRNGIPIVQGVFSQEDSAIEESVLRLDRKYRAIETTEPRFVAHSIDDAELVVVAFGTAARIARKAVRECRERGHKVGLFRPVTLWPFPRVALVEATKQARKVIVVEMNLGQMVDDVRLSLMRGPPVVSLTKPAGAFAYEEVFNQLLELVSVEST